MVLVHHPADRPGAVRDVVAGVADGVLREEATVLREGDEEEPVEDGLGVPEKLEGRNVGVHLSEVLVKLFAECLVLFVQLFGDLRLNLGGGC